MILRRTHTRRPGLTLTEALVAMFIAAMGMICLLVLFPLGALQMGQAIKDERTSQAAMQADGMMRYYWKQNVVETGLDGFVGAFSNPNLGSNNVPLTVSRPMPALPPGSTLPGYPVFVDPMGYVARGGRADEQFWVGGRTPGNTPDTTNILPARRSLAAITNLSQGFRFCTMLDDLTFDEDFPGQPATPVTRQGKYNWLAVLQKPNVSGSVVNFKVVVFDGRAPGYAPAGKELVYPRDGFSGGVLTFSTTSVNIPLDPAKERPQISKGRWILDASVYSPAAGTAFQAANFHRVVSVTEVQDASGNPQLEVELQTPFQVIPTGGSRLTPVIIVMNGVSEVFDRPPLSMN